ncbi:PREDICTED: protein KRI1 homolog, partial [Lepidothrix coronata]|uniref:Protein KRI1 homolog n=1 Tax=Lepidothrix coronata TaxID=321398 RepID=A0A6J0J9H8_9PASS
VQTFPRHIPTSVRRRDERRKEKREQLRERKKKERARRREELKQLKNLKRQELAARLARIRDASGSDAFGLTDSQLQEDFDPAQHDQLMAEWFGEEYYGRGEEEKPQFEEEEGLEGEWGILAADDKELNRWCSLRKTCMYRSEQEERQDQANYSRRAQNVARKRQILRSLVADPEEPQPPPAKPKPGKKRREKRKRLEGAGEGETPQPPPPAAPPKPGGPRRRGGPPLGPSVRLGGREFSGKRLEAFGLNPRRLRFRQLRRQRRKEGGVGKAGGGKTPEKGWKNSGKNGKGPEADGKKQKSRKNT